MAEVIPEPNKTAAATHNADAHASQSSKPSQPSPPQAVQAPPTTPSTDDNDVVCVSSESAKQSRRSKFTPDEELILVGEVAACKAHIAPHAKKGELFSKAAAVANSNPRLKQKVTQKSIQDRYTRLQKEFDEGDKKESAMSGIGGKVGEMVELLSEMRKARENKKGSKSQQRAEMTALEAEKEEIGAMLANKSLCRQAPGPSNGSASASASASEAGTPRKVGKGHGKPRRDSKIVGSEMVSFPEALKESELVRADVENRKPELEEKRLRIETDERAKDREKRREEREAQAKLDIEKFRLLMDSQASMVKEVVKTIKRDT